MIIKLNSIALNKALDPTTKRLWLSTLDLNIIGLCISAEMSVTRKLLTADGLSDVDYSAYAERLATLNKVLSRLGDDYQRAQRKAYETIVSLSEAPK